MHDRIIRLYDRTAHIWDEVRGRTKLETEWMDRFMQSVRPGGTILDIGCGSGRPVATYLIEHGFDLVGVDSSAAMIAMCRARFPTQQWAVADMRALDLGRRFDGLIAWHSFFHLHADDQRGMFERFAAHALPGAALMFTSGAEEDVAIGEWEGEPLYHASLSQEEYRTLLDANGFEVLSFTDGERVGPTVWIARKRP